MRDILPEISLLKVVKVNRFGFRLAGKHYLCKRSQRGAQIRFLR